MDAVREGSDVVEVRATDIIKRAVKTNIQQNE
jgi:hypothetical protein